MFIDPLHTLDVHPAPNWAFDPRTSTLERLDFCDWIDPTHRRLSVGVIPNVFISRRGGGSHGWVSAVVSHLPADVRRWERHSGILLNGHEAVVFEASDRSRGAYVRGPQLTVFVEEHGCPSGGPLLTPDILQVIRTVRVPANEADVHAPASEDWKIMMALAQRSIDADDIENALVHWDQAAEARAADWLASLRGADVADGDAALDVATILLTKAANDVSHPMGTVFLDSATRTLYRCHNTLTLSPVVDGAVRTRTDEMISAVLDLHVRTDADHRPNNIGEAWYQRGCDLYEELSTFLCDEERAEPHLPALSGNTKAAVALLAFDDAKTSMMIANSASDTHWDDVSAAVQSTLHDAGVDDDETWAKRKREGNVQVLHALVLAGRAIAYLPLGATDVSPIAMRREVLTAARQLIALSPREAHFCLSVEAVLGCVDLLHEMGDESSLSDAHALLNEGSRYLR
jgi:hypothetical protein